MAKITIDLSGIKGLAQKHWGDAYLGATAKPELRYLGKDGQVANGIYNPYKRYGYLSAGNDTHTVATFDGAANPDPNAIMGSTIYDIENNDAYFAEVGEELYKADGPEDTALATVLDLGSTGTPRFMDLEIYEMNGSRKLYYSYEKSGNMEIGNADLPFASANNDWVSADVTNPLSSQGLTNTVFMRVADNGFMYIFQDNNIHKVDGTTDGGTNGTVTANVLQFPTNFQITDAIDYRGYMFAIIRQDTIDQFGIETNVQSQHANVGVYVWDRLSTLVNTRDYIPLGGVKEIRKIYIGPKGDLRLITVNSQRIAEIRSYTGSTFKIIKTIGYKGAPAYSDSLVVTSLSTLWYAIDGNIYAHGQVTEENEESLYRLATPAAINNTGAILFGGDLYSSEGLYTSYITTAGTTPRVSKWQMFGSGTPHRGDVYSLVKYLPSMSKVNYIDIYCRPAGSGSGTIATVKIYFNQSTTAFASKTITLDEANTGYKRFEINKSYVNSIQIEVEFATGISLSGDTDFAPSVAIVDYTPTKTKG